MCRENANGFCFKLQIKCPGRGVVRRRDAGEADPGIKDPDRETTNAKMKAIAVTETTNAIVMTVAKETSPGKDRNAVTEHPNAPKNEKFPVNIAEKNPLVE